MCKRHRGLDKINRLMINLPTFEGFYFQEILQH
jgi:hypothetical protein